MAGRSSGASPPLREPRLALLVAALGLLLAGCGHRITPPGQLADPVPVYVIDYGRHASLALSAPEGRLTEWSWGDWNWFAMRNENLRDGIAALFFSTGSTLARRSLSAPDSADALKATMRAEEVLGFMVERTRTEALQRTLEARFLRRREAGLTGADGRHFVPDDRHYSLFDNSVHELNRWLEALGARVDGAGVTARFRLAAPR